MFQPPLLGTCPKTLESTLDIVNFAKHLGILGMQEIFHVLAIPRQ